LGFKFAPAALPLINPIMYRACVSVCLLPKFWQSRRKFGSRDYPLLIPLFFILAFCGVKNSAVLTFDR